MSGYVLFQMWGPFRKSLIDGHLFYVEQARKRLLSHFDDIASEAERAAEDWLKQNGQHFDPNRHDPDDFYETAHEVGIEFYGLLSDMREQTRVNVVAGMFHEWDKQLRGWLAREIQHWHRGDNATSKVWSADFGQIGDLLESFGWNVRSTDHFATLDACRLVVNVHKHGEGKSLDELRNRFPEYLKEGSGESFSDTKDLDHSHLKVSDDQFQAFSEAILAFWRDVPENVLDSQMTDVPDWFQKGILKDRGEPVRASKK